MSSRSLCPTPHKKFFFTKAVAKEYLKFHAEYFAHHAPKIYIYRCGCTGFHLTKTPPLRVKLKQPPTPLLVFNDRFKQYLKR